jgi:hypothetical protein
MGQTEGNGQGIGGIRRQGLRRIQERPDHGLNLFFRCPAISHDRLFHLQWAILLDLQPGFGCGQDGDPPRLAQEHGALHILGVERIFYRHEFRTEFFDLLAKAVKNLLQALRKGLHPVRAKNPAPAV